MQRLVPIEDLFKGRHFGRQIIVFCVTWYTSFKVSLQDLVIRQSGLAEKIKKGQFKTSKLGRRRATMTELRTLQHEGGHT